MKSYKISFSGACHSGKTTLINALQMIFGDHCEILEERIRTENPNLNIDELRKDPLKCFEFQEKVIRTKIEDEKRCQSNKVAFIDRNLLDTYYYLTTYCDRNIPGFNPLKLELQQKILKNDINISVLLKPIKISKELNDPLRPKDLPKIQMKEYENIKHLFYSNIKTHKIEYSVEEPMVDFFKKILLSDQNMDLTSSYDTFFREIETKNLLFDNIIMNRWGPIAVSGLKNALNRAFLFVDDDYGVQRDLHFLLGRIRLLKGNKTSLTCHPTGYLKEGGIMVVGEAPGRYGEGLDDHFLKPTFIFTRTAQVLRSALAKAHIYTPYLTNLCKYALSDNKASEEDFEDCWNIFETELKLLKPSKIICLGKKVGNYLDKKNLSYPLIKKIHPAYALYRQLKEGVYEEEFIKGL